ncbi:hypothetical protein LAZ67_5001384 [Cordylochernes scorpioides]|uniref:Uncharacterized protein n=1 Tax=Cordylochernes scorpioides TaxID=51811 RepID=A0ABY6KFI9_9ARAC|nr:hypothetical protein LAZ67_5001384 [Cordylochernes scorpioides]
MRYFVAAWESLDPKAQTLNNLTARLLIEETRNQQSGSSKQDEALLHRQARTKPKDTQRSFQDAKKNTKCHYCHKIGHWSRECRKRLANEKNKSKNLHDSKGSSSDYGLILCDNQVEPNDIWYADSGASCSMTFRREWFKTYTPFTSDHPIYLGDNSTLLAEGMGDIEIQAYVDGGWYNTYIRNVLYSPQLKKDLYSLSTSTRRGFNVIIKHDKLQIFMDNDLKAVGVRHDDLYRMLFKVTSSSQGYITSENKLQLWHERLAHLPVATLREMATKGLVDSLQPQDFEGEFFFCEGCQLGKAHRKSCYPSDGKNYQLDLCKRFGIIHEFTAPYVHEQIGRIERDNRTIVEAARSMLNSRNLPGFFWAEACNTATNILNRSATKQTTGTTPYELFFGTKPNVANYKIFGCNAYMHIPKENRKKWDNKSIKLMFLGYENTSKNFRLWDWKTRKIRISKDVTFDEKATQATPDRESTKPKEIIFQINSAPDESPVATANIPVQEMPPVSDISSHPMITRSKVSNSQCNFALADEPSNYIDAITSSDSERWKLAMDEEIHALNKNKTWTLERLADGHKPIGCKWVYKIKTESDGTIQRFKARLVAKGYSQIKNVDYFDTFSPVVRYDSLRILLSHAASERMFLKQFDVKTAFLNGELEELVYLEQPEGYKRDDNSCYRLHKSLYGLKQSSRNWNKKFTNFLYSHNFKTSDADPCIFIGTHNDSNVILALYVDDGIILSKDKEAIAIIMDELEHAFDITSGSVNFFVGLQIKQSEDRTSIFIHQSSYIDKILSKFNMADCIPASVPMDPSVILTKQDCPTPEQKEKMPKFPFREAVGSLMFASCVSRPDITYAVSQVSKFLEYPGPAHCTTVKNIFRYLKGTPHMGILFTGQDQLVGYSDSDFARDVDSRKSTTGYAFMMNGGTVSWASQRQPIIALSTTESEYIAACSAAKELIWIRRLLQGIGCDITKETELYIDNQAAIKLVENPVFHKRTKHIDVRYHFIRSKHEEALGRRASHVGQCNFALADEPSNYIDAITSSDSERWKLAMDEEIHALNKNKTWTLERLADGHKPIGCKWVYKIKTESDGTIQRFKARLVAKGYSQIKNVDYFDTFSPVVRYDSLRILLSHAASERMFLKQFDVKTAFLNGELEELVYLEQPEGYKRDDNSCYRLHKSLYGLKQSSRNWNKKFTNFLYSHNFKTSDADPCIFIGTHNDSNVILALYVDDGIILSKDKEAIAIIMDELEHAFDITSGSVNFFVGLQIKQSEDRTSIFIHQSSYIDKILSKFNMADCIPASVPMDPSVILTKQDCPTPEQKEKMPKFPFREAVGSLMFASCVSRPDITYAVSQVSKFLEYPGPAHCTTVKNIFRYLKGTPHMGILFTGQDQLVGYSDSDFARDVDSRKSTTGYAFMMNGGTVSWASQRQPIIALSTTESEYIAACSAAKELIWIRRLLQGIGCDITKETELYIDNQAAIKLVENPVFHKRTKHIDVRYHFIRSKHEEGELKVHHVCSSEQLADIMTKPLPRNQFHYLRGLLNILDREGVME